MKESNPSYFITILILFSFILGCRDNNVKAKDSLQEVLSQRSTPLDNKKIAGNWEGSFFDKEYGFKTALKLTINQDNSFTWTFFAEGEAQAPSYGKVEAFIEKTEKTDGYGENKSTTYSHGIKFHENTQYGLRTWIYQLTDQYKLEPVHSFDPNISLAKE